MWLQAFTVSNIAEVYFRPRPLNLNFLAVWLKCHSDAACSAVKDFLTSRPVLDVSSAIFQRYIDKSNSAYCFMDILKYLHAKVRKKHYILGDLPHQFHCCFAH